MKIPKIKVKEIKSMLKVKEIKEGETEEEQEETLESQLENVPSRVRVSSQVTAPTLEIQHVPQAQPQVQAPVRREEETEVITYETRRTDEEAQRLRRYTAQTTQTETRTAPVLTRETPIMDNRQIALQQQHIGENPLQEDISRKYDVEKEKAREKRPKYPWEA